MTSFLVFSNPGEIDPRCITTLGVNVKAGDSPIGFFGTGLKYALAVSLRLGCQVEVQSGLRCFQFETKPQTIRGKTFQFIYMHEMDRPEGSVELGFTLELGKTWLPWMVYREFWCNAKDEQGEVTQSTNQPLPRPGHTQIIVQGEPLLALHSERHKWILQGTPLASHDACDIYQGQTSTLFYRGIAVATLPRPSLFTYNIKQTRQLTEDRTLNIYDARLPISEAWLGCQDQAALRHVLCASKETFEHDQDFDWAHLKAGETFQTVVQDLFDTKLAKLNRSAMEKCKTGRLATARSQVKLTKVEEIMLGRAKDFLLGLGHQVCEEIQVVDDLGSQWVLGTVQDGKIILTKKVFAKGTKYLASTLLEEHLHAKHDLRDCSRELQDWLFDRVVSLGEELLGKPL